MSLMIKFQSKLFLKNENVGLVCRERSLIETALMSKGNLHDTGLMGSTKRTYGNSSPSAASARPLLIF